MNKKIINSSDILLIKGGAAVNESIITGENLPQIKDAIQDSQEIFDIKKHKQHVILAGSEILLVNKENNAPVLGIVLNTGFNTTKGKLAKAVLFQDEINKISQREPFILLGILLFISICISFYTLYEGLRDQLRDKNKLFLRCIQIVVSVVPIELPMIMNYAINKSVGYLKQRKIFCTEPFRIPLAGKVGVCVFDKTGTLTEESLHFKGIAQIKQN